MGRVVGTNAFQNLAGDTPEQIANQALFSNISPSAYWYGTEDLPDLLGAWSFLVAYG